MTELRKVGKAVDMITLLTTYSPQDLGGANYVNDLTNYAHIEKFDDHVSALLEVWREREKKNVLHISAHENWTIDRITTELAALTDQRVSDHSDISTMLVDVYEDPFIEKEIKDGAPSGIKKLDDMTNGFQDGELTILAARPSMGKSDVMLHIAKQSGWKGYLPTYFFTRNVPYKFTGSTHRINWTFFEKSNERSLHHVDRSVKKNFGRKLSGY